MNSNDGTKFMQRVVGRENMMAAYRRVMSKAGAGGSDKMPVTELREYLKGNWPLIKEQLLGGTYRPQSVRGVAIPKPNGGTRLLGIPSVIDRLIQQALYQTLSPIFEPGFSSHSYGFRPGRNAQQAVLKAKEYQAEGKRWVVDMDLAKFFDEVNHDILMARVARKVKDKEVLRLIRAYLRAGMMVNGVVRERAKGTPQGGNLSPLLANIILDDLDKELERRGHSFCRYADDCNIYVQSRKAGERVMSSLTRFLERKLKLRVNKEKSAVARPWERKFLGYSFTWESRPRIRVAKESIRRFSENIKELWRKGRGKNLERFIRWDVNPVIRGWINYFRCAETKTFAEDLDGWIRRKLRCILWRQWKRPWTRRARLIGQGLPEEQAVMSAFNQRGPWWNSGAAHMNLAFPKKFFDSCGLVSLVDVLCGAR
jgi:group II intron reverse transcriptase/maturase